MRCGILASLRVKKNARQQAGKAESRQQYRDSGQRQRSRMLP